VGKFKTSFIEKVTVEIQTFHEKPGLFYHATEGTRFQQTAFQFAKLTHMLHDYYHD